MDKDLKNLLETGTGKKLKKFLLGHYLRLKNIDSVEECETDKDQALAFKSQKKAAEIIKGILSEISDMTADVPGDSDEDYGL